MTPQKRQKKAAALVESGRGFHDRRDFAAAERSYRQAIELDPGHLDGNYFLGTLLAETGRLREGIETLRRAERIDPASPLIKLNLGTALQLAGEWQSALEAFRAAEEAGFRSRELLNNLGLLCCRLGAYREAATYLDDLVGQWPEFAPGRLALARLHQLLGDIPSAQQQAQLAFRISPQSPRIGSALLMISQYDGRLRPPELLMAHRQVARLYPLAEDSRSGRHPRLKPPWRVGFVSPDLGEHAVAFFLLPLVEAFDREKIECFFYSNKERQDAAAARLKAHARGWREIAGLSDDAVRAMIDADSIDVLVDLAGHTADNRLGVFATRAAPVQVTCIGYPGTTGLPTMDYILSDARLDPPGEESVYTEAIYRLPFFACYKPPESSPEVSPLPMHDGQPPVLGVFHGGPKLTQDNLSLWARLLLAVPESRLLIMCKGASDTLFQQRQRSVLESRGVSAARLLFREFGTLSGFLEVMAEVDLCLDALPWNGHTVTCHALWMGVPTLTLAGDRRAGRMGADLMGALEMGDFVARDADEFVRSGIALLRSLDRLADIRAGLRQRLAASAIMDADAFARSFEAFVDFAIGELEQRQSS